MKILIADSQGGMMTIAIESTDTFASLRDRMFVEHGLQMDFTNLHNGEDFTLQDNVLAALSRNNQLLALDADENCPSKQQHVLDKLDTEQVSDAAAPISTCGAKFLQPKAVEHKEEFASNREQLLLSQQLCSRKSSENSMQNLSSLCRLCAEERDEMIPIFGPTDAQKEIVEQIRDCLPIVVRENDAISKNVCTSCQEILQRFQEFRNNVLIADEKFKIALNAQTAKTDKTNFPDSRSTGCERKIVIDHDYSVTEKPRPIVDLESTKCRIYNEASSDFDEKLPSAESQTEQTSSEQSSDLAERKKSPRRLAAHECLDCGKKFVTEERLRFHNNFHKPDARPCYCAKCDKLLVSESALYHHLRNVHMQYKEFCCDICGKQFRAQAQMKAHQRMHKDERPFECNVCKKCFYSSEILKRHNRLHLPDKPNQCDQCGKRFDRTNGLTKHLLTHQVEAARSIACRVCSDCHQVLSIGKTDDATLHENCEASANNLSREIQEITLSSIYRCEFCERCFADVKSVKTHKDRHVGVTPYICQICDISYATYNQATAHKAAHRKSSEASIAKDITNVPKYLTCQFCDKTFLHFTNMNIHRKTCGCRNGKKTCRCCGNSFASSKELSEHKRGTDSDKKFQCHNCPMAFGSYCALEIHKEGHTKASTQRNVLSCLYCGKSFLQKANLSNHIRIHTGERPYACDLCGKSYRIKSERDNHRRIHTGERPFKCTLCDKAFAISARLREHTKFHQDIRPYKCNMCDRAFRRSNGRKIHMTIHTGEKPFKCDICGTSFRRCGDMRKHKKTQHGIEASIIK